MLIGGAQLDSPAAPLGDLLRFGLQTKPEEVALLSGQRSLTWRELEEASSRLAAGYLGLGLVPGDRVASKITSAPTDWAERGRIRGTVRVSPRTARVP